MHLSAGILAVSAVSDDLSGRRGMRRGVYDLFSGTEKAAIHRDFQGTALHMQQSPSWLPSPRCFRSTRPGRFCAIPGCCTRGFGSFCRRGAGLPTLPPAFKSLARGRMLQRPSGESMEDAGPRRGSTRKIPACSVRLWAGFAVWERPAESWKLGSNDKKPVRK